MAEKGNKNGGPTMNWEEEDLKRIERMFACVDKQAESVKERVRDKAVEKLRKLERREQREKRERQEGLEKWEVLTEDRGQEGETEAPRGLRILERLLLTRASWAGLLAASLTLAVLCGVGFGWLMGLGEKGISGGTNAGSINRAEQGSDVSEFLEAVPSEELVGDENTDDNRDKGSPDLESVQKEPNQKLSKFQNSGEDSSGSEALIGLVLPVMLPIVCAVFVFWVSWAWGYKRREQKKGSNE